VDEMLDVRILDLPEQSPTEGRVLGSKTKFRGYADLEWNTEKENDRQISRFYVTRDPNVLFDVVLATKLDEGITHDKDGQTRSSNMPDSKDSHAGIKKNGRRRWLCL
jgi:hypothetical protein